MKKMLSLLLPIILIGGAVAVVIALTAAARDQRPERREEGPRAMLVDTIQAHKSDLSLVVHSQGSVRPRTETSIVAEVSGKIVSVSPNFIAGGFFRAGEVLLQIDPSDYEAALKRAQANLASRHAQLADQKARSEQALKDWRNLGRSGQPSDLVLRKPQLAEAQAGVQAAEAELQKAERDLERTRIRVPYDGLVRSKDADIGQFVSPGTRLGVTFAVDRAEIRLPLSATDASFLDLPSATDPGDSPRPRVQLVSDVAGLTSRWEAEIIRTEGVVDERSRVTYAVASLDDPYGVLGVSRQDALPIGTFVRAEIQGRSAQGVVILPRSVMNSDNNILVVNGRNELEVRQVTVLRAEPENVYISDGVEDGEHVITTRLEAPIPGTLVEIRQAAS
jgi:RND family efflux transporter MFP subunit